MRGKFIVLYGSNNLGKSHQLDLLEQLWTELGRPYVRLKYPIYDLEPTGPLIDAVLRKGFPMEDQELQGHYAQNRKDFEPYLMKYLESGVTVIAEDYVITGKAWGLAKGVDRVFLDEVNAGLLEPDVSICLDGERFGGAIEKGHRHEAAGNELWERSRRFHVELAREYGLEIVDANMTKEKVHERIVEILDKKGVL